MNQIEKIQALYEMYPELYGRHSLFSLDNIQLHGQKQSCIGTAEPPLAEFIFSLHAAWPLVKKLYEAASKVNRNPLNTDLRRDIAEALAGFETLEEEG